MYVISKPISRCTLPICLITSFLLLSATVSPAVAQQVRIGLVRYFKLAPQVTISATGDLSVEDVAGRRLLSVPSVESIALESSQRGIKVTRTNGATGNLPEVVRVRCVTDGGRLVVSSPSRSYTEYQGIIEARNNRGRGLTLVNELDIEDYLLGVLPAEMPRQFLPEAQKAQAIAARTFAAANLGKHTKLGYGLCDTTCCQVYLGSSAENDEATQAVHATKGMVLIHDDQPICAYYCTDCGGYSQRGSDAKGQSIPYLESQPDKAGPGEPDFCANSSAHDWTKTFTAAEIEQLLSAAGIKIAEIRSIEIESVDTSGRVLNVRIAGAEQDLTITGAKMRSALGTGEIKSTMFTVHPSEDGGFVFEGKGLGHGMGLCQYGANGMASAPYNDTFQQILAHYFPETFLRPLSAGTTLAPEVTELGRTRAVPKVTRPKTDSPNDDWPWNF